MVDEFLDEKTRAEDIILGALGFDSDARIVSIHTDGTRFSGTAMWSDGEEFAFESDDELTDMEHWAIAILTGKIKNDQKA